MISPKYHHINQKKTNRDRISYLAKDLERSKMAVENITKFSVVEGKFKQDIKNVQEELQTCMMSIAVENKKHKVLGELVSILKGEMTTYQETKKKQKEAEELKKDKLIDKYQYGVDQILQKHNEEVAKIHSLKDMANSSRSQRVVYSSLFKKLEREIKYYQQIYKQNLIISQFTKVTPLSNISSEAKNNHKQAGSCEQKSKSVDQMPSLSNKISMRHQPQGWRFLTSNNQSQKSPSLFLQKKFHSTTVQQQQISRVHTNKQQKFAYTKQLLRQISEYTNLIDKLKIHSECSSSQQIVQYYADIEKENKLLLEKILECDRIIDAVHDANFNILKIRDEEELDKRGGWENGDWEDGGTGGTGGVQELQDYDGLGDRKDQLMCKFASIASLFNVQINKENLVYEETRLLSDYIEFLCQPDPSRIAIDRQETSLSETVVEVLLDRMEKFNNCERIMDRGLLQQEYYKEMSKKKQPKNKKEPTK